MDTQMEITFVRKVLCNNYLQSHWSLPLWSNKPKKFNLIHLTVSHQEACTGWAQDYSCCVTSFLCAERHHPGAQSPGMQQRLRYQVSLLLLLHDELGQNLNHNFKGHAYF